MFSNSTDWEIWSTYYCKRCLNDINEDCPIILEIMIGNDPPEIRRTGPSISSISCEAFILND